MGKRKLSDDLKRVSLKIYWQRQSSKMLHIHSRVLPIVDFSLSTFYRARRRFHQTGDVVKARAIGRGRPHFIVDADAAYLLRLARCHPTTFLDEYCIRLARYRHLPACIKTIHNLFIRHGFSIKRVQKMALERCPEKRSDFIRRIGQYPASYIVSMDEVSKDDRTYSLGHSTSYPWVNGLV